MSTEIKNECHSLRLQIEDLKKRTKSMEDLIKRTKSMFDQVIEAGPADIAEARANMRLAYRHLDDACMRLGKVIQAIDGGVSVYDEEDKAGAGPIAGESVGEEG